MQARFTLILGTLGFAAVLVAAPVGVQDNIASLHEKAAFAAPGGGQGRGGGHGGGQGRGGGHGGGQGPGNSASASVHGGSGPGKSGSAPGHGGTGNGQAVGHDAVSGVESQSAHHNGYSLEGNMNAAHASAQGFAHAAPNSMVGAIREAVQESYVDSSDEDTVIDRNEDDLTKNDEIDLDALESALAGISNKDVDANVAGAAAGEDGDSNVADAVAGEVDGKVSEPDPAGP
jgi:hypothetical protein